MFPQATPYVIVSLFASLQYQLWVTKFGQKMDLNTQEWLSTYAYICTEGQ